MPVEADPPNLSSLSLRAIEVFASVAATGSMTAAAEQLGVTQSAISQAVRTFEEAIGQRLLDRSMRPAALTMTGAAVREHAVAIVRQLRALEQTISAGETQQMPLLRLGMANTFAVTVGPSLVERLRHLARNWSIGSGPTETRIEGLEDRRVDFVLTFDETPVPDRFRVLPILSEPYLLALPARFSGTFGSLQELADQLDMLRYGHQLYVSRQIEMFLEREGVVAAPRYRFDTIDAVIAMVAAGLGWALITPLGLAKSASLSPRLSCRALPGATLHRRLALVWRKGEGERIGRLIQRSAIAAFRADCLPGLARLLPGLNDGVVIATPERGADGEEDIPPAAALPNNPSDD